MKISLIGPVYPYRGGIAHYTTSLSLALQRAGHNVQIISFKRQYPAFLYPGKSDKDPSSNPACIDAEYLLDPLYPWTWVQTAKKLLTDQPDLVLIQWWTTFWSPAYAFLVSRIFRTIPVSYLVHNVIPHESRFWDKWLVRLALQNAGAFIAQTDSQQKALLDLLPQANISRCNHPVYHRFTEKIISKKDARRKVSLPIDTFIVLFFGIIRPYKGLMYLIDALTCTNLPVHLVIAGEFWENVEIYKKKIDDLNLSSRITIFNKYVPDEEADLFFSAADIMVAPYVGGTQSGVVELAIGYSLPVIVTDAISAGISDVEMVPLKIVPAGNVNALALAIDEFSAEPLKFSIEQQTQDAWAQMVSAVEKINSNFQWNKLKNES